MRLLFTFFLSTIVSFSYADDKIVKPKSNSPVSIQSDSLEFDQEKNQATFSGNVIVNQDDTEIKSNKIIVHYFKAEKDDKKPAEEAKAELSNQGFGNRKIVKIDAVGNVILTSPDKKAFADKAIYNLERKQLEMFGNVKLVQDKSELYGNRLMYDLASNKASIFGEEKHLVNHEQKKRVKAVIMPKE
ncbi:MAG: lipopolysaccharide transport periplasmic protein LptA [Sphingobacteriia bacterium]|nr:lipopolysaccharide transport periplasmic protein LptA [Sphingobacteriia bacterium]